MYSCLLLHPIAPDRPVPATRCDSRFRSVGNFAHGAVSLLFDFPEKLTEAVLYIPALTVQHTVGRTRVRVTECSIKNGQRKTTLQLCGTRGYDESRVKLTYSEVKKRYSKAVLKWAGVQSNDDFIVHVGCVAEHTSLIVELEFLMLTEPQTDKGGVYCTYGCMLPASSHSIELTQYQRGEIKSVSSSFEPNGATRARLSWKNSPDERNSWIVCSSATDWVPTVPFGFTLELQPAGNNGLLTAELFSLLLPSPVKVQHTDDRVLDTIDGLILMNCILNKSSAISEQKLLPSDFVFLVDCSGSMSGIKIQNASETLILCLKSLPAGSHFNIIAFGSKYYHLFPASEELSEKTLEKGVQFCNQLKACLGGTELLNPVRWLLRRPPSNGLPRQVFLITDGGAPNQNAVLQIVSRHRSSTRFHSFGLGHEVCPELIFGIAAATGGSSVIVERGERLQTHVLSVLTASLSPRVTKATPLWTLPKGYSLSEATPSSCLETIYSGSSCLALAFLNKTTEKSDNHMPTTMSVSGNMQEDSIVTPALPSLQLSSTGSKAAQILLKAASFLKIVGLEEEMHTRQPKLLFNHSESTDEPASKRVRVNGLYHTSLTDEFTTEEKLLSYSLSFGIPCALTCLQSSSNDLTAPVVILPGNYATQKQSQLAGPQPLHSSSEIFSSQRQRKRKHSQTSSFTTITSSLTSLAHNSVSTLGGMVKTAISITTMGLVNIEDTKDELNIMGERIEDQIYHDQQQSRIHWDDCHQLIFPSYYYQSHPSNHVTRNGDVRQEKVFRRISKSPPEPSAPANSTLMETNNHTDPCSVVAHENGDSLSCELNSLDLVLTPPTSYYPLVLMQSFAGSWTLTQPLCYATGVSMREFLSLPSCYTTHAATSSQEKQFWPTIVALTCLIELFSERKVEWKLVAYKGESWLKEKKEEFSISLDRAQEIAKGLILKK